MKIYKLVSEDLTTLCRMGDDTEINFEDYFSTAAKAKAAAQKDYGDKITWTKHGGYWTSGDLSHVMYTIYAITPK